MLQKILQNTKDLLELLNEFSEGQVCWFNMQTNCISIQ